MILRRLSNAVRTQDWFTVLVETLIVVSGVFIGLQVNNWNEARQDYEIARQLEAGLIADANVILDETRVKIEAMSDGVEAMESLLDVLSQKDEALMEADISAQINLAFSLPSHAKRSPTLLEAQNDGVLSLIKDDDIRHAILEWDSVLQDAAHTQQARREFARDYVAAGVRLQSLIGVVPFEEALSDSGSRNDLIVAISMMAGTLAAELAAFRNDEEETKNLLAQLGEASQ